MTADDTQRARDEEDDLIPFQIRRRWEQRLAVILVTNIVETLIIYAKSHHTVCNGVQCRSIFSMYQCPNQLYKGHSPATLNAVHFPNSYWKAWRFHVVMNLHVLRPYQVMNSFDSLTLLQEPLLHLFMVYK